MKLYISETQGVASILNQLSRSSEKAVELVFPEQSVFFADPENLQLLKNQGILLRKELSVISPNEHYVQLAQRLGLAAQVKTEELLMIDEGKEERQPSSNVPGSQEQEIEEDYLVKESKKEGDFTKRYFDLGKPVELSSQETPIEIKRVPEQANPLFHEQEEQQGDDKTDNLPLFRALPEEEKRPPIEDDLKTAQNRVSRASLVKVASFCAVVLVGAFLYFYLPSASIQLFAQRQKISFSFNVSAQKNASAVDVEKRVIPAQFIEITKELSLPFEVKQKTTSTQKASGHLTVYNQNGTPQFMVPSRFQSSSGNIYWSQRNINIPAKGSLDIEVVADKPGATYNLTCTTKAPCDLTVPAWKGSDNYTKIYGKATQAITGGSAGQGYIVSSQEFESAQANLRTELTAQMQKELTTRIPQGYKLLTDANHSDLADVTSTPALNNISPDGKATIQGKMSLSTFAIKESDVKDLVNVLVKNQLDSDKQPRPETISTNVKVNTVDAQRVSLAVNASEEVAFSINIDELKTTLVGKSEEEVRKILGDLPKVQSAQVTLWPFWVRSIPGNVDKVIITVK